MKRFSLIAFFLVIFPALIFAQGYKISIRVKGIKDSACYLAFHQWDKQYLKDTARADSKGLFTFTGKESLPGGIYLAVLPGKRTFEFVVGNEQNFSLETDTLDYIKNMKVKNSVENTVFFDYLRFINPRGQKLDSLQKEFPNAKTKEDSTSLREQMEELNKEVKKFKEDVIKNYPQTFVAVLFKALTPQEPSKEEDEAAKVRGDSIYSVFKFRYYKDHFFDNIDFSDDRILRTPIYYQKVTEYMSKLVVPHVDSISKAADFLVEKAKANKELFKFTVWYITHKYETSNLMGADAVYVHMVEKYYMTKQAYWLDSSTLKKITDRAMLLKPLLLGKKAPNLFLPDSSGRYYGLHNLKAKYIILYFWDHNCGHCQKETPKLYEVYKKYKSEGVEAYCVDIDRDRKKWIDYINKHQLNWINVNDLNYTTNFKQLYDIYSTPVIYILNEKKEIIAKRIGVEQVDEILGHSLKSEKKN
jgi:peroxiredoxin